MMNFMTNNNNKLARSADENQLGVFFDDFQIEDPEDARQQRLMDLKEKIKKGEYQPNDKDIADSLIKKISSK